MALGRIQRSAGPRQLDHRRQQLVVTSQPDVVQRRLATPIRQLRRLEHVIDSSSGTTPQQLNYTVIFS
jgi:hypothetical protein